MDNFVEVFVMNLAFTSLIEQAVALLQLFFLVTEHHNINIGEVFAKSDVSLIVMVHHMKHSIC